MVSKKEREYFSKSYNLLKSYRNILTKQQYKTFLGQMKSGNIEGALKGMKKVIGGKNARVNNKQCSPY